MAVVISGHRVLTAWVQHLSTMNLSNYLNFFFSVFPWNSDICGTSILNLKILGLSKYEHFKSLLFPGFLKLIASYLLHIKFIRITDHLFRHRSAPVGRLKIEDYVTNYPREKELVMDWKLTCPLSFWWVFFTLKRGLVLQHCDCREMLKQLN